MLNRRERGSTQTSLRCDEKTLLVAQDEPKSAASPTLRGVSRRSALGAGDCVWQNWQTMRTGRGSKYLSASAVLIFCATEARAEPPPVDSESAPFGASGELQAPNLMPLEPEFDRSPGWSMGLEGYAGFAVLSTEAGGHAQALAGGLSRFQVGYFQAGGFLEATDGGEHHWRSVGGFVGAFLPYRHWVDFEFAGGVSARTYRNSNVRYGPDGYEATTQALLLRAGFSDRSDEGLFGFRLGAQISATFDLERHNRTWQYELASTGSDPNIVSGATKVGGFSVGIAVTAGFDIGRNPAP